MPGAGERKKKVPEGPPWEYVYSLVRRTQMLIIIGANFAGAFFCTSYFLVFESYPHETDIGGIVFVTSMMFLGLIIIGSIYSRRWQRDIFRFLEAKIRGRDPEPELTERAQRKILNAPYVFGLISLANWGIATLFMSTYILALGLHTPSISASSAFLVAGKVVVGVIISGIVTCVIIFFAMEALLRRVWPYFFPRGGLVKVPGVFRMKLPYRTLITFTVGGILPLVVMAVLSYTKAGMMLQKDPEQVLDSLLMLLLFLLAMAFITIMALSRFVSMSIVRPVQTMERTMARVEQGDLSGSVPVSSNDELGAVAESFNQMLEGLRDRERIKETFGRFVTPQIAHAILEQPPVLGGENTEVSILFSDVRNYTTICEQMSPEHVIHLLNNYFSYMVRAVEKHNGIVYQFVGDGIMAVFGAPVNLPDHADCAVRSALEMVDALAVFNTRYREGSPPLRIGIGINTGPVVAGIIGTEQRMEYRVVGDTVNLSARIESLNKDFQTDILINRSTRNAVGDRFPVREMPPIKVKGKEHLVQVYQVLH